jgi:hypothetical protein
MDLGGELGQLRGGPMQCGKGGLGLGVWHGKGGLAWVSLGRRQAEALLHGQSHEKVASTGPRQKQQEGRLPKLAASDDGADMPESGGSARHASDPRFKRPLGAVRHPFSPARGPAPYPHRPNPPSPVQAPPTDLFRPVQLGGGLYVCGDHRCAATLDGALKSGRLAAEAVVAGLKQQRQQPAAVAAVAKSR